MLSYSVVILVCSVTTSHADCKPDTAIDVMRGPKVETAMQCAFGGQALLASTELVSEDGNEYGKVICIPSERVARLVPQLQAKLEADE